MTPGRESLFIEHERNQALVVIFRLGIEDGAKPPLPCPLAAGNYLRSIVAGFSHHVFHARLLDRLQ